MIRKKLAYRTKTFTYILPLFPVYTRYIQENTEKVYATRQSESKLPYNVRLYHILGYYFMCITFSTQWLNGIDFFPRGLFMLWVLYYMDDDDDGVKDDFGLVWCLWYGCFFFLIRLAECLLDMYFRLLRLCAMVEFMRNAFVNAFARWGV